MTKVPLSRLIIDETGWRGRNADIAASVVMAESRGIRTAKGHSGGQYYIGLMQISLEHAGKFGIPSDPVAAAEWLIDARNNLEAAYKLWIAAGGNDAAWSSQWQTFREGTYRKFPNAGGQLIETEGGGIGRQIDEAASSVIPGLSDAVESVPGVSELIGVGNFLKALADPSTWLRVGKGTLGGVLILTGVGALVFVVANKAADSPAAGAVAKVITKGKAK